MIDLSAGSPFAYAVALILGLLFGSFANVCIHRLPDRLSVVWPGSSCPSCAAAIRWYDNIPLISYAVLRGRCRRCGWPIPWRYPLVEGSSAAIFVLLAARHGLSVRWGALCWLGLSILVLIPIDLRHGILPDRVTLPGIGLGVALAPFSDGIDLRASLMGAILGGAVPYAVRTLYMGYARARSAWRRRGDAGEAGPPGGGGPPSPDAETAVPGPAEESERFGGEEPPGEYAEERREGMGLGDVKMLAMVGAFLGMSKVLLTMLLGSTIGSLLVIPMVLSGRHTMKTPVPFGPFLGVAALVSLFWGDAIIQWYLSLASPAAG